MRPKRTISESEKQYLLSLKPDDITLDLLHELFADTYDKEKRKVIPAKFNTYDEFALKKGEYFNTSDVNPTNCGLFIINKYLFETDFAKILGYRNKPIDKKELGKIQGTLDTALMEDEITTEQYINFLNRLCWIAFTFNTEVCTSLTINSTQELPEIKKAKSELRKKYKDELESDNNERAALASIKMEAELVEIAKKAMKDDPAVDLYNSGARGAFGVAYKNGQIMKGPVYNEAKHKFDIMYEPIASGIKKENIPTLANSVITSSYSSAIATGDCGYKTKKLTAVYQTATLDKRGSDCHSKGYNVITLTDDNYSVYSYGFIIEGNKLVRLDSKSKDKYIGKTVKMRSNCYCLNKKTCNMCAGDKYYLLGQENYGLTAAKISSQLMQKRLKAKHDATQHPYSISSPDEAFI